MGLLDKITGKAQPEAGANKNKTTKKVAKSAKGGSTPSGKNDDVLNMAKEGKKTESAPAQLKDDTGRAHRVLKQYHLSEKSNQLSTQGRYVFVVDRKANKIEIRKAIESVYDVHVTDVNIVNTKGKFRAYGRTSGRTSDWKKAIVTLKAGETISGLAEGV